MGNFRYLRRALLRGNTDTLVQGPAILRGQVRRNDATLSFGFATPAKVTIHVDGVPRVVDLTSAVINDVVDALNDGVTGLLTATASDEGGYLVIQSNSVGAGASLEVFETPAPAVDAAPDLGLPTNPDPLARADGGDRSFTPRASRSRTRSARRTRRAAKMSPPES